MTIISSFMVLSLTVCFNEYIGNRYTYMGYLVLQDFVEGGKIVIEPRLMINRFGHLNIVLVHGLVKFMEVKNYSILHAIKRENLDYQRHF